MVNTDINDREFLTVSKQSSLYLPLSKHRWLCTTLLQSTSHGQYLVGGDRRGSIHVYLLTTESDVIIKVFACDQMCGHVTRSVVM